MERSIEDTIVAVEIDLWTLATRQLARSLRKVRRARSDEEYARHMLVGAFHEEMVNAYHNDFNPDSLFNQLK